MCEAVANSLEDVDILINPTLLLRTQARGRNTLRDLGTYVCQLRFTASRPESTLEKDLLSAAAAGHTHSDNAKKKVDIYSRYPRRSYAIIFPAESLVI